MTNITNAQGIDHDIVAEGYESGLIMPIRIPKRIMPAVIIARIEKIKLPAVYKIAPDITNAAHRIAQVLCR